MAKKSKKLPKIIKFKINNKDWSEINRLRMTENYKFQCYADGVFYFVKVD